MPYALALLLLALGFGVSPLLGQTDLTGSFTFDGAVRDYRLHLPPDGVGPDALPLVLNLHGYTSNAVQQEGYSRMNEVADTAGFAVCYPNGLNREWNVGWAFNRATDDVGFLRALVDTLVARHGLDRGRVYSCGMSNGGFMSYRLACEASDVFAAVGSVTGGMVPGRRATCDTSGAVLPVIQIHGTADPTVAYGGSFINDPIETTVAYWAGRFPAVSDTLVSTVPDRADDGLTTVRTQYVTRDGGGGEVTLVDYYLTEGALHTWPGGAGNRAGQTEDFSASAALWQFFRQHSRAFVSDVEAVGFRQNPFRVWPNPARESLRFAPSERARVLTLHDATGRQVLRKRIAAGQTTLELPRLPAGQYYGQVTGSAPAQSLRLSIR